MGRMLGMAEWGGRMSAGCSAGPTFHYHGKQMVAQCARVPSHAKQLLLPRL